MPTASARRLGLRTLKYLAIVLGGCVLLAAAAIGVVVASFGTQPWKDAIAQAVKEHKGRTLRVEGELSWALFPAPALRLGRATLSEHESEQAFASLEGAQVSLGLAPLLRGEVVIETLELTGLRASLVRLRDGRLNIDDLLARDPQAPPPRFDIGALKLTGAALAYRDEGNGRAFSVADLALATGHLGRAAEGRLALSGRLYGESRALNADVALAVHYRYDLEARRYGAPAIELKLAATEPPLQARLLLSDFEATEQTLKAGRADLELELRRGETAVAGGLASALVADLGAQTVDLPAVTGELTLAGPRLPRGRLELPLSGSLRADLARRTAAGRLATRLDETKARASFAVARFSPLRLTFELDVDRLDLDRYFPPEPGGAPAAPAFDPALLEGIDAEGTVRIGELRMAELTARNLRLEVKAAGGRIEAAPH